MIDETGLGTNGGSDRVDLLGVDPSQLNFACEGDDLVVHFGEDGFRIRDFADPWARVETPPLRNDQQLPSSIDPTGRFFALGGSTRTPVVDPDPGVNHSPVVEGSGRVELQPGQVVSGTSLFGQIWDPDGPEDLERIVFCDSTPGAGWLELDGRKTDRAEVARGETWRVRYVAGDQPGSNDIVVEAFDRSGDSNNLTVRVVVGGVERGSDIRGSDADDSLQGTDLAENIFG